MKRSLAVIIFLFSGFLFYPGQVVAGSESGEAAFYAGDYKTALKIFNAQAEGGNYGALYFLGEMHREGLGVSQSFAKAAEFYLKAAKGNHPYPQLRLGEMHRDGKGVAQDHKAAYMWFDLASSYGEQKGATERDRIAEKLSPAEINEAKKTAKDWVSKLSAEKRPN